MENYVTIFSLKSTFNKKKILREDFENAVCSNDVY